MFAVRKVIAEIFSTSTAITRKYHRTSQRGKPERQGAFYRQRFRILRSFAPASSLPLSQRNYLDPASPKAQQSTRLRASPSRGFRLRYGAHTTLAESFFGG